MTRENLGLKAGENNQSVTDTIENTKTSDKLTGQPVSAPIAMESGAPSLDTEESEDDKAKERDFTELDRIKDMAEFLRYEKHPSPAQLAREFGISRHSSRKVFNQAMAFLEAEKVATSKTEEAPGPVNVESAPETSASTSEKISHNDNGHVERYNTFRSAVESAQNLAQLKQAIKTIPGIVGSVDVFTQSKLLQIMESIVKGESPIHAMTRSGGLRFKLEALLKTQTVESVDAPAPVEQPENPNAQAVQEHLEKMRREHSEIPVVAETAEDKARREALRESIQRDMSDVEKPAIDKIPSGTFDNEPSKQEVPFAEIQPGFRKMWRFLSQDAGKRQTPEQKLEPLPRYEFNPHESTPLPNLEYLKSTVSLHEQELVNKLKGVKNADDIYDVVAWNNGLYGYEFETAENRSLLVTDQTRKERMFTADEVANQIKNYVLGKNATLTFPNKYGLHEIAQAWKAKRDNVWFRRWGRAWKNRGEN